jgi:Glycosyl hydrolase family 26
VSSPTSSSLGRLARRGRASRWIMALTTVGAMAAVALAYTGSPASAVTGKSSGVFSKGGPSGVSAFGTWRNASVAPAHAFAPATSWTDLELSSTSWLNYWGGSPYRNTMVFSFPMLPSSGGTMADGAAGAYDAHWRTAAKRLVGAGMGNATLRIGWELNGTWFPWSAKPNPANYAAYFRHIVTAMRSATGQTFKFVWSVSNGYFGFDPRTAYPGNAYVDFIGDGLYDTWYKHPATPQDRWAVLLNGGTKTGLPAGLAFWTNFAVTQGKPFALTEWGLVNETAAMAGGSGGGGDDPYFIQQVYDWVIGHNVAFELYFNTDANDGYHRLDNGQFPNAAALYQHLFGGL